MHITINNRPLLIIFCLIIPGSVFSQDTSKYVDNYHHYGIKYYNGAVFAHTDAVQNTAGSRPWAIELEYSKRHTSSKAWNTCRGYPSTGVLLAYKNYDYDVLGHGVHLAYYVQYHALSDTRISPIIRGTAGLEYDTNPYHEIHNPENRSYSMHLNSSLQVALGAYIKINRNIFADMVFAFNHISNGGASAPNKGINWPSAGLGIYYSPDYGNLKNRTDSIPVPRYSAKWLGRVNTYLTAKSKTFDEKEIHMIGGAELLGGRRITNLNNLLGGFEWNLNGLHTRSIEYYNLSGNPNILSIFAGHEFVMGKFRFSQKLGVYVFNQMDNDNSWYHKWGLQYKHNTNILVGIEVKAHKHVADYTSFTLGYAFY
ncbi:MAG: acyloxyacyl hydrolase [Bacteroidales bacterium]